MGLLGDKKGRLKVLFASIILYSLGNIANGFVQNVNQYALIRFITGIGLAGELGAGITFVTELLPKEKRGIGYFYGCGHWIDRCCCCFFSKQNLIGGLVILLVAGWDLCCCCYV